MVCGWPSSRISKSSLRQVGDDVASGVGDRGIDLDGVDLYAEGWLLADPALLAKERVRAARAHEEADPSRETM